MRNWTNPFINLWIIVGLSILYINFMHYNDLLLYIFSMFAFFMALLNYDFDNSYDDSYDDTYED